MVNISQHLVISKTKVKGCLYLFIHIPEVVDGGLQASWVFWLSLGTASQSATETDRESKLVLKAVACKKNLKSFHKY